MTKSALTAKDLEKLREAITFPEHPSLLMKLANLAGLPAQKLLEFVPAQVTTITDDAPRRAMDWSIATMSATPNYDELEDAFQSDGWSAFWHRLAATASGGVGVPLGWPDWPLNCPSQWGFSSILFALRTANRANESWRKQAVGSIVRMLPVRGDSVPAQ